MLIVLVINTILCVPGIAPAFGIQLATVMSCANSEGDALGALTGLAGYFFPAAPILSIIGSWVAYWLNLEGLAIIFVAIPWVCLLGLGTSLGIFFWRGNRKP